MKKIDLERAKQLASDGLTNLQIAQSLGISKTTFYKRIQTSPKFCQAVEQGKAQGIATVANALMEQVKQGNTTAMIFYLKSRAGWIDTAETKRNGDDNAPVMDEAELDRQQHEIKLQSYQRQLEVYKERGFDQDAEMLEEEIRKENEKWERWQKINADLKAIRLSH